LLAARVFESKQVLQAGMSIFKALKKNPGSSQNELRRGRRRKTLLANIVIVTVLSVVVALVITWQSGGTGFSISKSAAEATVATVPNPSVKSSSPPALPALSDEAQDGYKLETGPLAVTEVSGLVLHDEKRNKDVRVRIFYPVIAGKYPVIIFSHGAGGSEICCESLTRHWATYGYITIQPIHDDAVVQRRASGDENARFPQAVREALKNSVLWESRPRDISFLLDSLSALQKRVAGLNGKIDTSRIGVAGHSMGAHTAEAIAGALVDLPGHPGQNFSDARAKAILCLSPQGPGQFGLTAHSFSNISLPFMGITGSQDSLGPLANAAWHKIPFERSQPGDKYEVFIQSASHMSFITAETANPARSSQAAAILGYTNSASLAFWDAYLKDDPAAKKFLQSDALERSSHGAAKLSRR
jgi:predicted dienelactone hydrolase